MTKIAPVAFVMILLLSQPCLAGEGGVPPDMLAVWTAFQKAVAANDSKAVSALSHFPVRANDLGGNIASEAALTKRFATIFQPWVKTCFKHAGPEVDTASKEYLINCNGYFFGFKKYGGRYRFAYINNVNE